ncbi:hypothetical protein ACE6H2_013621 [Prunus campanulata]
MHVVGLSVCSVQRWDFLRDGMVTKVGHTISNNRRGPIKGSMTKSKSPSSLTQTR